MRIVVPYTKEVLDSIIYEYQELFWPIQFLFILLSLWIIYSIKKEKNSSVVVGILAFFWICIGAYEINYYNSINWIGTYVGSFFIFQGLLLLWFGVLKKEIIFKKSSFFLVLSLLVVVAYPLIELSIGINLYELSIVGMLPNTTIVFSLLLLVMNRKKIWSIYLIPIIWLIFTFYWNYLLLFN